MINPASVTSGEDAHDDECLVCGARDRKLVTLIKEPGTPTWRICVNREACQDTAALAPI